MSRRGEAVVCALALALAASCSIPTNIDLPEGSSGLGLDDLRFSPTLRKIVVPAARTGRVDLIDVDTQEVTSISGFTTKEKWDGTDLQGVQSADEGRGFIFAVDRTINALIVADPATKAIVATVALDATEPDYVRWVESTSEVWITQPGSHRIDVLSVGTTGTPMPTHAAFIDVPDGPEGLRIDNTRHQAYVNLNSQSVAVISIPDRVVKTKWATGCSASHGIPALDESRGLVFAGCSTAEMVVLDANQDGKQVGSFKLGPGATILAYSPELGHVYLRGDPGNQVAILGVSSAGKLALLELLTSPTQGHCMTADDKGFFYVCDWQKGRVLRFKDRHPATTN